MKYFFAVSFTITDNIYQEIVPNKIRSRRNINISIISASEIIAIAIVDELITIDSEKAWFGFCIKDLRELSSKF
ncbi:hypothetical protein [Clostridium faecium]|uniref:PIN domain-containing protein n=1 Tax=Clostridium faecium TaxID=2762223 RepID=A0ABR8YTC3_9CLOT|nr:hypothetical protein [Clostridium faecium]MBD8047124.1 hypothetical protein [Clostridium faecium]